jgi:hypothetical protein
MRGDDLGLAERKRTIEIAPPFTSTTEWWRGAKPGAVGRASSASARTQFTCGSTPSSVPWNS